MKNFLLKLGNVASWTIVGATGIYSLAALLYGVLPAEATEPILTALNTNVGTIVPVGISSAITGITIATAKILGKTINYKLKDSNLMHELWRSKTESKISTKFELQEKVIDLTVQKQNVIIAQNEQVIKNQTALLGFQAIQAKRNIKSGLTPQSIKDLYQAELDKLETMDFDLTPITKVVTETVEVTKEIIPESNDRL